MWISSGVVAGQLQGGLHGGRGVGVLAHLFQDLGLVVERGEIALPDERHADRGVRPLQRLIQVLAGLQAYCEAAT